MNITRCQFAILALFLVSLLEEAKALRCITCSLSVTEDCKDPFDMENTGLAGECELDQVCVKHIKPALYESPENINRGCANKNYCYGSESTGEMCLTCDSHLCNSSLSRVGQHLNVAMSSIITIAFVLKRLLQS